MESDVQKFKAFPTSVLVPDILIVISLFIIFTSLLNLVSQEILYKRKSMKNKNYQIIKLK